MRKYIFLLLILWQSNLICQSNCEIYKNDTSCYSACLELHKQEMHRQGSFSSQKHLDNAIKLCPTLSDAYFEKSVAFLKRGLFVEWKKLIDKAVELNPKEHLPYRGWVQFTFLHNYNEAIKDLNELGTLLPTDYLGTGQFGDYDLRMILALSYKMKGEQKEAIRIIEDLLNKSNYSIGLYDYLHLGVLFIENNELKKSIISLKKQCTENELAESYFYLGKAHYLLGEVLEAEKSLNRSLELYLEGRKMKNLYYEYHDQIYKQDINHYLKLIENTK